MRKAFVSVAIAVSTALCMGSVSSHGVPTPKHGGLVDIGGEISFEMVTQGRTIKIFVEDHGKPLATKGASGELLLGSETGKRLAALKDSGENSVSGPLPRFKPGDRLFVRVVLGDGSIVVGEFLVR